MYIYIYIYIYIRVTIENINNIFTAALLQHGFVIYIYIYMTNPCWSNAAVKMLLIFSIVTLIIVTKK